MFLFHPIFFFLKINPTNGVQTLDTSWYMNGKMGLSFWNNTRNSFKISAMMQKYGILLASTNPGDKLPNYHNFYCSLVVCTCIDLPKIWPCPSLSSWGPFCYFPILNPACFTKLNWKWNWCSFSQINILMCCRFIENLTLSSHQFICQFIFVATVWKAPWIICG